MPETTYVVLREVGDSWGVVGHRVAATSAGGAIRAALTSINPADGAYVAVPLRSWRPLKVHAVQTTVLNLKEAEGWAEA